MKAHIRCCVYDTQIIIQHMQDNVPCMFEVSGLLICILKCSMTNLNCSISVNLFEVTVTGTDESTGKNYCVIKLQREPDFTEICV